MQTGMIHKIYMLSSQSIDCLRISVICAFQYFAGELEVYFLAYYTEG